MKNLINLFFTLASFFVFLHYASGSNETTTETKGTVSFSVTTVNHGGEYAPKNVMAIWVTTSGGTFVKSLKVMAAQRKSKLITWLSYSGGNTVDAITGATLLTNQTHTVSWDCTNTSGALVPDGNYKIHVEYTDNDFQGPYASFEFTKSTVAVQMNPADLTYFINIALTYTPEPNSISLANIETERLRVYPNPFSNATKIQFNVSDATTTQLEIINLIGSKVYKPGQSNFVSGENTFTWYGKNTQGEPLPNGIYFCILKTGNKTYTTRIILNQ